MPEFIWRVSIFLCKGNRGRKWELQTVTKEGESLKKRQIVHYVTPERSLVGMVSCQTVICFLPSIYSVKMVTVTVYRSFYASLFVGYLQIELVHVAVVCSSFYLVSNRTFGRIYQIFLTFLKSRNKCVMFSDFWQ